MGDQDGDLAFAGGELVHGRERGVEQELEGGAQRLLDVGEHDPDRGCHGMGSSVSGVAAFPAGAARSSVG
ncbi:hypothetical protein BCD48_26965 [Pseudofrankia sp. BMG5.36]|nr:hypothetical protein BCD48_26965 [Pseudofrankia sp. BMG5.36]